jgi:hypothetical protein
MKDMIPLRCATHIHCKSAEYHSHFKRKIRAHHAFIQARVVAQDCSNISPSLLPSSFGARSGPGCEPFVPASRHRGLSLQMRCARHFPIFSGVPQKAILSRNSSPIANKDSLQNSLEK